MKEWQCPCSLRHFCACVFLFFFHVCSRSRHAAYSIRVVTSITLITQTRSSFSTGHRHQYGKLACSGNECLSFPCSLLTGHVDFAPSRPQPAKVMNGMKVLHVGVCVCVCVRACSGVVLLPGKNPMHFLV